MLPWRLRGRTQPLACFICHSRAEAHAAGLHALRASEDLKTSATFRMDTKDGIPLWVTRMDCEAGAAVATTEAHDRLFKSAEDLVDDVFKRHVICSIVMVIYVRGGTKEAAGSGSNGDELGDGGRGDRGKVHTEHPLTHFYDRRQAHLAGRPGSVVPRRLVRERHGSFGKCKLIRTTDRFGNSSPPRLLVTARTAPSC